MWVLLFSFFRKLRVVQVVSILMNGNLDTPISLSAAIINVSESNKFRIWFLVLYEERLV